MRQTTDRFSKGFWKSHSGRHIFRICSNTKNQRFPRVFFWFYVFGRLFSYIFDVNPPGQTVSNRKKSNICVLSYYFLDHQDEYTSWCVHKFPESKTHHSFLGGEIEKQTIFCIICFINRIFLSRTRDQLWQKVMYFLVAEKGKRCTPLQYYATGTVNIIFNKLGNIFLWLS